MEEFVRPIGSGVGPEPSPDIRMIAGLLPAVVASAEAFSDPPEVELFPAELAFIARAVPKRRNEFGTVRACARQALAELGAPAVPLVPGKAGAPQWPDGIVGSMTHCEGYRAAAVASDRLIRSVGIDAEPHLTLPEGVLESVSLDDERRHLARLRELNHRIHWDRLLFSAKESVYKTWYPLTGRWLGFEDARLRFDVEASTFGAEILTDGSTLRGPGLSSLTGRWRVQAGLVITAITLVRS
jgi:4'-phosphopantetheinyl transferase EntD